MLIEAILFGDDQGEVGFGLFAAFKPFSQHFQPLEPRAEVALTAFDDALCPFGFEGVQLGAQSRRFGFGVLDEAGDIFVALNLQKALEGFLDAEQAQEGPHQFIELSQSRIGRGIG